MNRDKELEQLNDDRIQVGDRVVWINNETGPEQGTVRKIGIYPNCLDENPLIGVEFDKPIGIGVYFNRMEVKEFFLLNCEYISFIPSMSLTKSEDFYGKPVDQIVEKPIAHILNNHSYQAVKTVDNFPGDTLRCNELDQSVKKCEKRLPTLTSEQTVVSVRNDQRVCYMKDIFPEVDPSEIEQHCEGFSANVKLGAILNSFMALNERSPQPSTSSQRSPSSCTARLWSLQPGTTPDICRICRRRSFLPCSSSEGIQNYKNSTEMDGNNNGSQEDLGLQIVAQRKIFNCSNCIDLSNSSENNSDPENMFINDSGHEANAASDLYQDDTSDCVIIYDQNINKQMPVYNENVCTQKKPVHDHAKRLESVFDQNIRNPIPVKQEFRLPTLIGQRIIQDIAAMYPEIDIKIIENRCQKFGPDTSLDTVLGSLIDDRGQLIVKEENDVDVLNVLNLNQYKTEEQVNCLQPGLDIKATFSTDNETLPNTQNRYYKYLTEIFPNMDVTMIEKVCQECDPNARLDTLVNLLVKSQIQLPEIGPSQEVNVCESGSETAREGTTIKNKNVLFLTEIFPEMKVVDIEKHCQQFDPHVCRQTLVNSFIDGKMPLEGPNGDGEKTPASVEEIHVPNNGLQEVAAAQEVNNHNEHIICLTEMFPDIDVGDIEALCNEHDPYEPVETLVSKLVDCSRTIENVELNLSNDDIENITAYQTLLSILPKADPDFLRENLENIGNNEEKMVKFVENALSTGKYPTYENYKKKRLAAKLQREYREDFNIERFLEEIADPAKYYAEKSNAKSDATVIIENKFLLSRYPRVCAKEIADVYNRNNKNLYLTCKLLDFSEGPFQLVGCNRNEFEECYKNIDSKELLQEIAFIENEADVLEYRHTQLDLKMYAIARATEYQELLTCNCCYDDQFLTTDMVTCEDGHLFCKDCVKKSIDVQVGWGKTEFPCLLACGKEISNQTLKTLLNPVAFDKLMERRQLEEVKAANIPDLETCQFCSFSMIPLPGDKVFTCLNEDCMQVTCRLCKELDHLPLKCNEVEKDEQMAMRKEIEDRMTNALARECWQCKTKIVKSSGCNKMICTCGAFMCYLCRQPIIDYSHFGVVRADGTMCPLRSTTKSVHADAVQKEAVKAKAEALARHPGLQLKYDPTTHL